MHWRLGALTPAISIAPANSNSTTSLFSVAFLFGFQLVFCWFFVAFCWLSVGFPWFRAPLDLILPSCGSAHTVGEPSGVPSKKTFQERTPFSNKENAKKERKTVQRKKKLQLVFVMPLSVSLSLSFFKFVEVFPLSVNG